MLSQRFLPVCTRGLIVLSLLMFSLDTYAADGDLEVQVIDATNQRAISNTTIFVTSRNGNTSEKTSDADGTAVFSDLDPGLYEVLIDHPNYISVRQPSVRVVKQKSVPLNIQLQRKPSASFEEIVVTGAAIRGDLLSSVGTSYKDRESLRSSAGSGSDVFRALDSMPGLFSDGEFSSYSVRGASPRDNLILVDGIPFDNVIHYSQSFGDREEVESGGRYSVFAPNIISGAEFQPGGWSSAYGGRAGSLLKLTVAEGNKTTPSYTARLDIAGVEVGYDGPTGIPGDTSLLISARAYDFGRFFETIGLESIGSPKLTDIIVKTTSDLSSRDNLSLLAIYAPEQYSRDIDNVLASDEEDPGNFEDVSLIETDTENMLFGATWKRLFGDDGELNQKLYYRYLDEVVSTGEAYPDLVPPGTGAAAIPARPGLLNTRQEEIEIGYRLDVSVDNALGRFSSGLRITQLELMTQLRLTEEWIRYEYSQFDFRPDPDQKYITLTPESINNQYQAKEVNYAAYADQEWEVSNWLLRAGMRYDRDNFSDEDLVSPRVGVTWFGQDGLRITATAGRYYQAPSVADRAADPSNSGLENEIIDQASLGLSWWLNDEYQFFIESYYQQMDNLVGQGDAVNQTFRNLGEGHAYGVDTAITRQFDDGWSADIKYSYGVAKVKNFPGDDERDADYNRPHSFSLGGVWEINERWKLSSRWKWASGKPRDAYIVHANVLGDGQPFRYSKETTEQNIDRYGHYSSVNFRADYRRTFGRTSLIAFVDVLNLLAQDNPNNSNFNERTGRDIEEAGEVLPIIGLRFEW